MAGRGREGHFEASDMWAACRNVPRTSQIATRPSNAVRQLSTPAVCGKKSLLASLPPASVPKPGLPSSLPILRSQESSSGGCRGKVKVGWPLQWKGRGIMRAHPLPRSPIPWRPRLAPLNLDLLPNPSSHKGGEGAGWNTHTQLKQQLGSDIVRMCSGVVLSRPAQPKNALERWTHPALSGCD